MWRRLLVRPELQRARRRRRPLACLPACACQAASPPACKPTAWPGPAADITSLTQLTSLELVPPVSWYLPDGLLPALAASLTRLRHLAVGHLPAGTCAQLSSLSKLRQLTSLELHFCAHPHNVPPPAALLPLLPAGGGTIRRLYLNSTPAPPPDQLALEALAGLEALALTFHGMQAGGRRRGRLPGAGSLRPCPPPPPLSACSSR